MQSILAVAERLIETTGPRAQIDQHFETSVYFHRVTPLMLLSQLRMVDFSRGTQEILSSTAVEPEFIERINSLELHNVNICGSMVRHMLRTNR